MFSLILVRRQLSYWKRSCNGYVFPGTPHSHQSLVSGPLNVEIDDLKRCRMKALILRHLADYVVVHHLPGAFLDGLQIADPRLDSDDVVDIIGADLFPRLTLSGLKRSSYTAGVA